jgi:integrase
MARGSAVIRYDGKRGAVWRIKYRDAAGKQVQETLGPAASGWTETRAQRELGKREAEVAKGFRRPRKETFEAFAHAFEHDYIPGRNLKRSTRNSYRDDIKNHLVPALGKHTLDELASRPELIDGYISTAAKRLSAKTIRNHLIELNVMFKVAVRWGRMARNPLDQIDRPRANDPEMNVLSEVEVARLLTAFVELEAEAADDDTARWWRLARRMVLVVLGTGLRRGELLGLRWCDVELLESRLTVRQAFVRNRFDSPKSRASRRTIPLGPRTVATLQEEWQETHYRADDSLVFAHPALGTPLDSGKLSAEYLKPAMARAAIEKPQPFRPFHDLRHTALTHDAASGNPQAYVQMKAGHARGTITERYIHAAQVLFPGAAERAEDRLFGSVAE